MYEHDNSARVRDALLAVLPASVDVAVRYASHDTMSVQLGAQDVRVRWVGRGWPRQVHDALAEVPTAQLLVAPKFSEGAKAQIEAAEASWVDETGAAAVHLGPLIIVRGPIPSSSRDPHPEDRWTPALFAVAEALLTGTAGTVDAVCDRTELAAGTVARALRQLQDQGLLESEAARGRNARRILTDPAALLERYAERVEASDRPQPSVAVVVDPGDPVREVITAGQAWQASRRRWAATGALAAAFQAPYLQRPAPLEVYLDVSGATGLLAAAKEADLEPTPGGRLQLTVFPSTATATLSEPTPDHPDVWCVPWPRTYADLRRTGVRGEEAAEHLRDVHLPTAGAWA